MARAATTRLLPGQHSIDRTNPRLREGRYFLDWCVCLPDGRLLERRTQGPTKGETRARARRAAAKLLAAGTDTGGQWRTTSPLPEYIEAVTRPAIHSADLRPNSVARYEIAVRLLLGECAQHAHAHSLRSHNIGSGMRYRALEACLREIAQLHGSESARGCRTVLSRYVIQQLLHDEVISGNPLYGKDIDLSSPKRAPKRGGRALTQSQYATVLDYLLELDPETEIYAPRRGRWTRDDQIAKRRNVIDLTLIQATTGMRVSEVTSVTWSNVELSEHPATGVYITVPDQVSKTHRGRRVTVLDPRVAVRLAGRRGRARPRDYIIGSPADSATQWDRANLTKACAALYSEIADATGVHLLHTARTHVWRATLNSLLLDVPEVIRAAYFGHDVAVNRAAYTDLVDVSVLSRSAQSLYASRDSGLTSGLTPA